MAANPPLVASQDTLFPAPYQNETIALGRDGVEIKLEGVMTQSQRCADHVHIQTALPLLLCLEACLFCRWSVSGTLFLTNMRLVFISPKPHTSGLQAFELPLAYLSQETFNQPILGCNNLTGVPKGTVASYFRCLQTPFQSIHGT